MLTKKAPNQQSIIVNNRSSNSQSPGLSCTNKDMPKNNKPQYQGNPDLLFNLCRVNISSGVKVLFSLFLLSLYTRSTLAECIPPAGSYRNTCNVKGTRYKSSDPNLSQIEMCRFDLHCRNIDGGFKDTSFYVQNSMSSCLRFFENCNGYPVMRDNDQPRCTTKETIERDSRRKMEL